MTCYMYFILTFIIRCTVSEILAEIDHKGPKSDLSDLENDLYSDSIHFIYWDKIGFTTKKLHGAIHLGSTWLLLNNINNYGKMG